MPFPEPRPPPLQVPDDEEDDRLHTELDSEDMRSIHPELWNAYCEGGTNLRLHHLRVCDDAAYDTIRHRFPLFTPPRHCVCVRKDPCLLPSSLQLRAPGDEQHVSTDVAPLPLHLEGCVDDRETHLPSQRKSLLGFGVDM